MSCVPGSNQTVERVSRRRSVSQRSRDTWDLDPCVSSNRGGITMPPTIGYTACLFIQITIQVIKTAHITTYPYVPLHHDDEIQWDFVGSLGIARGAFCRGLKLIYPNNFENDENIFSRTAGKATVLEKRRVLAFDVLGRFMQFFLRRWAKDMLGLIIISSSCSQLTNTRQCHIILYMYY